VVLAGGLVSGKDPRASVLAEKSEFPGADVHHTELG
jgi:hypothetical protein